MPAAHRTIRLFVSSTFSDFKAERDGLQARGFPKIKRHCAGKGLRFQAIDLRWGVSVEAGRNSKTMGICFRELRRCQETGLKPNFLVLLGDRYGWRPLPEAIRSDLFTCLAASIQEHGDLFAKAYREDRNAIPPAHILQPRDTWCEQEPQSAEQELRNSQKSQEEKLLAALEKAAKSVGRDAPAARLELGLSATHQEVLRGLDDPDAHEHLHAFIRDIRYGTGQTLNQDRQEDDGCQRLRSDIECVLDGNSRHGYWWDWRANNEPTEDDLEPLDDLKPFESDVFKALREVIDRQAAQLESIPSQERETLAHREFAAERSLDFQGRQSLLESIDGYLSGGGGQPLAVIGPAGSGKSALMAEAARRAGGAYPQAHIVARYIGATTASSDLVSLLRDIVAALRAQYSDPPDGRPAAADDLPFDPLPLIKTFHETLARIPPQRPLLLFIDGLDQLAARHQAHEFHWLPWTLPPHVRLIVSTSLPVPDSTGITVQDQVFCALSSYIPEPARLRLGPLTVDDAKQLLERWLAAEQRCLQETQTKTLLTAFEHEGNPLWLRVAAGRAARYAHDELLPDFPPDTPGLIRQVLDRLTAKENHGPKLVERALAYLSCARFGLAEDEMLDLLSRDCEVMADFSRGEKSPRVDSLPVVVWAALRGDLSRYLAEGEVNCTIVMRFYHRAFAEAAATFSLPDDDNGAVRKQRHAHLACYFAVADVPSIAAESLEPQQQRMLSELIFHLCHAESWDALSERLACPEFLTALVKFGFLRQALADLFASGPASLPSAQSCSTVARTLREQFPALQEDPARTIQTLYNAVFSLPESPHRTSLLAHWSQWMQSHCRPYTDVWVVLDRLFPPDRPASDTPLLRSYAGIGQVHLDRGYFLYRERNDAEYPAFIQANHLEEPENRLFGPLSEGPEECLRIAPGAETILITHIEQSWGGLERRCALVADRHGRPIRQLRGIDADRVCDFIDAAHLLVSRNRQPVIVNIGSGEESAITCSGSLAVKYCIASNGLWFALTYCDPKCKSFVVYHCQDGRVTDERRYATEALIFALRTTTPAYLEWSDATGCVFVMAIDSDEQARFVPPDREQFAFCPGTRDGHPSAGQLLAVNRVNNMVYVQRSTDVRPPCVDIGDITYEIWCDGKILLTEGADTCRYFSVPKLLSAAQTFAVERFANPIGSARSAIGRRRFAVGSGNDTYLGDYGETSKKSNDCKNTVRSLALDAAERRLFIQDATGDCVIKNAVTSEVLSMFSTEVFDDAVWSQSGLVAIGAQRRLRFMNDRGEDLARPWPYQNLTPQTAVPRDTWFEQAELIAVQVLPIPPPGTIVQCLVRLYSTTVTLLQVHTFDASGMPAPIVPPEIRLTGGRRPCYLFWPMVVVADGSYLHVYRQSPDYRTLTKIQVIEGADGMPAGLTDSSRPLLISRSEAHLYRFWDVASGRLYGSLAGASHSDVIFPHDGDQLAVVANTRAHRAYHLIGST